MAYSTQSDVQSAVGGESKLRELADWDADAAADASVIANAISIADAWIDAHLSKRFDVPLASTPALIRTISADEAVFRLKRSRSMADAGDVDAHKERQEMLVGMATGKVTVGELPLPAKSSLVVDKAADRSTEKAIRRDSLKGFW